MIVKLNKDILGGDFSPFPAYIFVLQIIKKCNFSKGPFMSASKVNF